jgi:Sulfotransferase family
MNLKSLNCETPVFIVGPVRSGSTVFRLMLDSHPEISNPGEFDFFFDMIGESGQYPDVHTYLEWLSINRFFPSYLEIDSDLVYPELIGSFSNQLSIHGQVLTMNVHRNFHLIPYVFPKARYIRLLRDPRDVARSCIGMGWAGHVYYGVDTWIAAEKSWQQLRSGLNVDQYMQIKYEDLMNDVESELEKVCTFLGVDYSDRMLSYASTSTYDLPDKRLCYQWKRKYTKRELQLVESKVSNYLEGIGYELGGYGSASPGLMEKIYLYFEHRKKRASHHIQRYGLRLYVANALANRFGIKQLQRYCRLQKNVIDLAVAK